MLVAENIFSNDINSKIKCQPATVRNWNILSALSLRFFASVITLIYACFNI